MAKGRIKKGKLAFQAAKAGLKHLKRAKARSGITKRGLKKGFKVGKAIYDEYLRPDMPWELGNKAEHAIENALGAGAKAARASKSPPRVHRPGAGRPSVSETVIAKGLVEYAAIMKAWLIDNDRIATGVAVNSIRVVIKKPTNPIEERYGIVKGQIMAAPHTRYALQGRRGGLMPPLNVIWAWMMQKGIRSDTYGPRDLSFMIARGIAANGTLPPHFSTPVRTSMTKVSASKIAKDMVDPFAKNVTRKWLRRIIRGYEFTQGETRTLVPTVRVANGIYGTEADILGDEKKDNEP